METVSHRCDAEGDKVFVSQNSARTTDGIASVHGVETVERFMNRRAL